MTPSGTTRLMNYFDFNLYGDPSIGLKPMKLPDHDVGVESINHPTGIQGVGTHTVNATVENYGNNTETFDVNCSIYNITEVIALSHDVESGSAGWYTYDGSGAGDLWHISTTDSHSPSNSWYCGDEITGEYYDNMYNWLISPTIDLSGYSTPFVTFWLHMDCEECCDPFRLYIYNWTDSSYYYIQEWWGYYDWTEMTVDLSQFAGHIIQLSFIFETDSSVTDPGVWIDDVVVKEERISSSVYYDEETVNIDKDEEKYVEFTSPWSASIGQYMISVSTKLIGDENPSNDCKEIVTYIQDMPDIWVNPDEFQITMPPGTTTNRILTIGNSGTQDLEYVLTCPWSEDFDSYSLGSSMHGQGGWKGWLNNPALTAYVTNVRSGYILLGSMSLVVFLASRILSCWMTTTILINIGHSK